MKRGRGEVQALSSDAAVELDTKNILEYGTKLYEVFNENLIENSCVTEAKFSSRLLDLLIDMLSNCFNVKSVEPLRNLKDCPHVAEREIYNCILSINQKLKEEDRLNEKNTAESNPGSEENKNIFDQWYTMKTTESVGNELNELRKDSNFAGTERNVNQLIGCIQTGNCEAIFDSLAKNLVVKTLKIKKRKKNKAV
mmetsp:Transcript_15269/g.18536  ORF Transcript_15269/g.18536 Transcript_15269/m.18536 type:complete len:196 (-) Transcript_15269:1636-2223(-)